MADLTHMGRVMLDSHQGDMPIVELEECWTTAIMERNRKGALMHSVLAVPGIASEGDVDSI